MSRAIFVNLLVKDLEKSIGFWKSLGFSFNAQFTDDKAACLIISEQGYAMLLTGPFFRTFNDREICHTRTHCEGLFALSCEGRAEADALMQKALANGGSEPTRPQDMASCTNVGSTISITTTGKSSGWIRNTYKLGEGQSVRQ
jgi:uncharacterized protein